MPKTKIEAKKVLDDIRAGLDDAALMEKYNLSIKGLHSVLEKLVSLKALSDSYIWTGRPPRESGTVSPNRELSAKEVVRDIKSGMTDGELMRKYKLSAKGMQNLLEQLMEAGAIKESDLEVGKPLMESTVELTSDMLPPFGDSVVGDKDSPEPVSAKIEASPPEVAPPPEQPQEVRIVETAEPTFPSTLPITAVTEPEREEMAGTPAAPPEEPHDRGKQAPQEPPQVPLQELLREHPARDLWAPTVLMSVATDEKPMESTPAVEPPSPPTVPIQEKTVSTDYEQTIALVWKCPACGQPQTQAYDECPVCGIVVAKFIEHQKKAIEPDTRDDEKKPEPQAPALPLPSPEPRTIEPPAAEPSAIEPLLSTTVKPRPVPTTPRSEPAIKPRRPPARPSVAYEEVEEPELAASGLLSGTLTFMAIAQLAVVLVYVAVRLFLERHQLFSINVIAWSFALPVLVSIVVGALLHSAAVLIELGREILSATTKNNRLLREIRAKLDKHTA